MGLIDTLRGPKSKYDPSLPYTYEARVRLIEDAEDTRSHFADTLCGLIEHLHDHGIAPEAVRVLEIYTDRETPIDIARLIDDNGGWLSKPAICRAFEEHYRGHIHDDDCSFSDRDRSAT